MSVTPPSPAAIIHHPRRRQLEVLAEARMPMPGPAGFLRAARALIALLYVVLISMAAAVEPLVLIIGLLSSPLVLITLWSAVGPQQVWMLGVFPLGRLGVGLAAGRSGSEAGLSLVCRTDGGQTREVLVSAAAVVPVGSRIIIIGPTLGGRQHAWFLRNPSLGQWFFTRGVLGTAGLALLLTSLLLLALGMALS